MKIQIKHEEPEEVLLLFKELVMGASYERHERDNGAPTGQFLLVTEGGLFRYKDNRFFSFSSFQVQSWRFKEVKAKVVITK